MRTHLDEFPVGWRDALRETVTDEMLDKIDEDIAASERQGGMVIPERGLIFRALELTPLDQTRVVILGQDPYPDRRDADGLAFSVSRRRPYPQTLRNIMAEVRRDDPACARVAMRAYQDLEVLGPWAGQGVLLLNTALTVVEGRIGSHLRGRGRGWPPVTRQIIRTVAESRPTAVFLAWGAKAENAIIDLRLPRDRMVATTHPAPRSWKCQSCRATAFFGSGCFSEVNRRLQALDEPCIDWAAVLAV